MMCLQSKTNKGVSMNDSGSVDAIYRFDADTYEFVELDQRLTLNGHGVPGLMVPCQETLLGLALSKFLLAFQDGFRDANSIIMIRFTV